MDRRKRMKHLLGALKQVIQILEQGDVDANLSVLKACYAEAQYMLDSEQDVSVDALTELSARVQTSIHPGMMNSQVDVAKIAYGFNMLSRVA